MFGVVLFNLVGFKDIYIHILGKDNFAVLELISPAMKVGKSANMVHILLSYRKFDNKKLKRVPE